VELLEDIARRWAGVAIQTDDWTENLASRFRKRLHDARNHVTNQDQTRSESVTLDIRRPVYSEQTDQGGCETQPQSPEHRNQNSETTSDQQQNYLSEFDFYSPDSVSMAFPPLPSAFQQYGFLSHSEFPQSMVQSNPNPEQFQIHTSYEMSANGPPVSSSQPLNTFDFGRFHDLASDINPEIRGISLPANS
jgi:hypothetical protein